MSVRNNQWVKDKSKLVYSNKVFEILGFVLFDESNFLAKLKKILIEFN